MSISSEKLRKVLHPIQIDTMHFRFKPRRNPGSQSQHRSVNRTTVPLNEKLGRSSAGHLLTHWCLTIARDHQLELFQALTLDEHLNVVVDVQVFFDFHEPESSKALPSKALLSDFLVDTINLWATDELFVEIDRNKNHNLGELSRRRPYAFPQIKFDPNLANYFETILRNILPNNTSSQLSDIRHLAKTAASDSSTFITRDGYLLSRAEDILSLVNVNVLSPTHLIVSITKIGYPLRSRDVNMLGWRTRHPIPKAGSTTRAP